MHLSPTVAGVLAAACLPAVAGGPNVVRGTSTVAGTVAGVSLLLLVLLL
jgi:hypothetical protein